MNHKTLGTVSLTDVLMGEITNVYGLLLCIPVLCCVALLIVLEVTGTEKGMLFCCHTVSNRDGSHLARI